MITTINKLANKLASSLLYRRKNYILYMNGKLCNKSKGMTQTQTENGLDKTENWVG